uniref:PSP domain-containing protein n=1 Tax=Ascaris lumbricoides TaxID=6252 RepID=A0A0M3ICD4_ASCLU
MVRLETEERVVLDTEPMAHFNKKELKELERRKNKNRKKKESKKKKKEKSAVANGLQNGTGPGVEAAADVSSDGGDDLAVEIEYVGEAPAVDPSDPNFQYFAKIFENFKIAEEEKKSDTSATPIGQPDTKKEEVPTKASISEKILQEEMSEKRREQEEAGETQKLSKRKLRLAMQPSIAELKEVTTRPDVVEWADVTSRDPQLLVTLKAYRNTVPVPRHWNAKRKYLAGKRGFERPPFELPDFIKRTGIMEMRETMWEKEDAQSLKSKMRERARPKLGRIDIDYQKLHDAFFKWQTKPPMTQMGELYYEGKELETIMKEKKPGNLSDELRIALGMPVGPNAQKFPPPWLIAMQRYGPPPSYPNLKIPGLNCPIPEGCAFGYHAGGWGKPPNAQKFPPPWLIAMQRYGPPPSYPNLKIPGLNCPIPEGCAFGYHAGGWGKPPVDEHGKPLYGDVFGVEAPAMPEMDDESRIERRHWGEIGSDEDSSEESDEDEEDAEGITTDSGFITPATTEGFATPSGITSGVLTGVETPDTIELRKGKRAEESIAGGDTPAPQLYTVLQERKVDRVAGQMMASTHVYDISVSYFLFAIAGGDTPAPQLYTVLQERKVDRVAGQMMASTHVYDISKKAAPAPAAQGGDAGVEVSLNPEDLDLADQKGLEKKYEEQLRKQTKGRQDDDEDFSDMVAEHSAKQNRKRKVQEQKKTNQQHKKYKDFKF